MLVQFAPNSRPNQQLGGYSVSFFTRYMPGLVLIVCFICYYMAVSKGEVPPFPYCTVTQTAEKYPQNILFRFVLSPMGVIMLLLFLTAYFVLKSYSQQLTNGTIHISKSIVVLAVIGAIFFQIAINTIDGGKMNGFLHSLGAVVFFIAWVFDMFFITIGYYKLRKVSPAIITKASLNVKIAIVTACLALLIEELLDFIYPGMIGMDDKVPIIEWGAVIFLCLFFYSFTGDWKNFKYYLNIPDSLLQRPEVVMSIPLLQNSYPHVVQVVGKPIYFVPNQPLKYE